MGFKTVKGFPNYKVNRLGVVKNIQTGTTLTPSAHKNAYPYVNLVGGVKKKKCYIHRLVAEAFIPNPNELPQVNHKDGNKHNHSVENLEWVTTRNNNLHAYKTGLKHQKKGAENKLSKRVYQYSLDGKFICEYGSLSEAVNKTGINVSNISRNARGLIDNGCGYIWKYTKTH